MKEKEPERSVDVSKQEANLEEAAKIHSKKIWGAYFDDIHPDIAITKTQGEISTEDFIEGAKWQQERMYSKEEVYNIIQQLRLQLKTGVLKWQDDFEFDLDKWFEQFKKK